MWTFVEAEEYLSKTAPAGTSVYGLGRINHLLDILNHPEKAFSCVTIVGTNGKGSVLAFLDALLGAHGASVGCHVKPHLESVTERIRINGTDSTEEEFAEALWKVKNAVDEGWSRDDKPTYFELIFAASLVALGSADVDVALLEAGLGGRLDAVNAVDAGLVVLSSVSFDHTELLGDSLESIAREKLAVVRPGALLVCQENPPEVVETVRTYAGEKNVRLIEVSRFATIERYQDSKLTYESDRLGKIADLELGLGGSWQISNAVLSLVALENFSECMKLGALHDGLKEDAIRRGLRAARIPGRWERIDFPDFSPVHILDGAHNPAGLILVLDEFAGFGSRVKTVMFGMKSGKLLSGVMPRLVRAADHLIFVPVPDTEAYSPEELAQMAHEALDKESKLSQIQISCIDSIAGGLALASEVTPDDGVILVTGSLYLVGEARSILLNRQLIPRGTG